MQTGLKQISEMLGPEAVILSNRRLADGLEIVAGVDEQEYERYQTMNPAAAPESDIIKANPVAASASMNKAMMTELFNVMADKNKQAFEAVTPEVHSPESASSKPAPVKATVRRHQPEPVADDEKSMDSDTLQMLRREIDGLKNLLKEQTDQLRESVSTDITPQYERLEARLQALGFGHSSVRRLMQEFDRDDSLDINWRRIMMRLVTSLSVPLYQPLSTGGIFALTGPTGAGKSTTIAKLAAHGVRDFGQDAVAIISLDWFKVGGQEMLKSVTDILCISYVPMKETDQLRDVLAKLSDKKLILIDTCGSSEA
ncbi:MAG: flagellar biosynthesis protein FlhF, partial [Reinekea sp.]